MLAIPKVSALDIVFGSGAMSLIPKMSAIPDEFKHDNNRWVNVVHDWFFYGLKNIKCTPKEGVNTNDALNVIKACIGSFEPSHEHKTAACAYMLSEWFDDITYERAKLK